MRCQRAQPVLSARFDGEAVPRPAARAADAHAAACPDCTAFAEGAARIRAAVRIRSASPVPDLVDPIMASIATEQRRAPRDGGAERPPSAAWLRLERSRRQSPARNGAGSGRTLVAAAVIGLVVGSVAVGGPWRPAAEQPLAVAAVADHVRAAAASLRAYSATYAVVERGFLADVAERRFEIDVAFLHPQRFRMDVRDLTDYPSTAWTRTSLTYIEDSPATYRAGSEGCETFAHLCSTTRPTYERSTAYAGGMPLPIDLIVPIATFGSTDGIRVVDTEPLGATDAVHLVMSFERAGPLFPVLELGGTWRPFHRRDRVDVWLDAASWFPLRTTITPSEVPQRRDWEMRFGLPLEPADAPILE
ncbi:MAG TPA: hypothetical protein VLA82_04825, partial [Actinomycetota bacterium]|nr:hypothetical protein [Actinomycetota bacterium]